LGEWRGVLDAAGLTFGVVGTVAEIVEDPQALANGFLRPLGETGMLTVDSPFSVSGAEKVPVALAPGFGEHGREILLEAGYAEGEIEQLRAAGVVGGGEP
jgi:formyl-CoA transferase